MVCDISPTFLYGIFTKNRWTDVAHYVPPQPLTTKGVQLIGSIFCRRPCCKGALVDLNSRRRRRTQIVS